MRLKYTDNKGRDQTIDLIGAKLVGDSGDGDVPIGVTPGGAIKIAEVGIASQRHNRFIDGVDIVVPGPAVIATDVITLGSAVALSIGDAILFNGTDFTETTGLSLDGVQLALTVPDTTHLTLDDGSGTVVDIDATGTATGTAALVKKVTFTQSENVRRYRVKAEALTGGGYMKWCEDADNALQAGAWLLAASSNESVDVNHNRIEDSAGNADGWSEWVYLSQEEKDDSLSNLYFAGDNTAGTWQIFVEAE